MRKKFSLLILPVIFLFLPALSHAQVVKEKKDRAVNRTERKVDRKIDQKVDEAVDKAFDKIGSIFKRKKKRKTGEGPSDSGDRIPQGQPDSGASTNEESTAANENLPANLPVFGGGEAKYDDSYRFDLRITYHHTSYNRRGREKDAGDMDFLFGSNGDFFGVGVYDDGSITGYSIMDYPNETIVSLNNEDHTGFAMPLNFGNFRHEPTNDDNADKVKIRKTGRTKTILGYHCTEYEIKSDDGAVSYTWLTTELPIPRKGFFSFLSQQRTLPDIKIKGGMFLEVTSTDKKGRKTHIIATRVNKQNLTLSIDDYEIQKMGMMNGK